MNIYYKKKYKIRYLLEKKYISWILIKKNLDYGYFKKKMFKQSIFIMEQKIGIFNTFNTGKTDGRTYLTAF